jgi:hypothetical protein
MKYHCNICNKSYKHRQSLYNHNKQKHSVQNDGETGNKPYDGHPKVIIRSSKSHHQVIQKSSLSHHCKSSEEPSNIEDNNVVSVYICEYCSKKYKYKQGKSRHLKVCKKKIEEEARLFNKELMRVNKELKKEIKNYKKAIRKDSNKQIIKNTNIDNRVNTNNSNNNSNNNIQNNTVNNNVVIALGNEELQNVFTNEEQLEVLNRQYSSLQHLLFKIYNEEKYAKYRNVAIKNIKDDYAYQYNYYYNDYELVNKSALIFDIISEHTMTIQYFLDENSDDLGKHIIKRLEKFLELICDQETVVYKKNVEAINMMLYNATKRYKVIMNLC